MRVLLATVGTRGDVQPFLALAAGLRQAGHQVAILTCPRFRDLVATYDIELLELDEGLLELLESDLGRSMFESLTGVIGLLRTLPSLIGRVGPIQRRLVSDSKSSLDAFRPDVVVHHPKLFAFPALCRDRGIAAVLAMFVPFRVPTGEFPLFGPSLGSVTNRLTFRIAERLTEIGTRRFVRPYRDAGRKQRRPDAPSLVLHAFSPTVVPCPADWPAWARTTGYWFLPSSASDDEMPSDLMTFLAAGPAPVYIGFGSMVGIDPARTGRIVIEALRRAEVRGVIATGWGGVQIEHASDQIRVVSSLPHERLFPLVGAVVHHGGAGTTGAALRACVPSVICPYGMDQPFWARRLEALGAAPAPLFQRRLSSEALAERIRQVVHDPTYRQRASELGAAIRAEDGIGEAIRAIERLSRSTAERIG